MFIDGGEGDAFWVFGARFGLFGIGLALAFGGIDRMLHYIYGSLS